MQPLPHNPPNLTVRFASFAGLKAAEMALSKGLGVALFPEDERQGKGNGEKTGGGAAGEEAAGGEGGALVVAAGAEEELDL